MLCPCLSQSLPHCLSGWNPVSPFLGRPTMWMLLALHLAWQGSTAAPAWPAVVEFRRVYRFSELSAGKDTPVIELFKDEDGLPRYRLECHNAEYDEPSQISYSGMLQCGLFAIRDRATVSPNLLAENTREGKSADWFNRGRFRSAQLREPCAGYTDYGADRTFRLRHMAITLSIKDVQWSERGVPTSFTFQIDMRPDPNASTGRAAASPATRPPDACYP
jgi:hypothetical protein